MAKRAILVVSLVALTATAADASAKRKSPSTVKVAKAAKLAIPDKSGPPGAGIDGVASSSIVVGKRFRGRLIRDVDVTLQTTGTGDKTLMPPGGPVIGPFEGIDVAAILRAPNGGHVTLFESFDLSLPIVSVMPTVFGAFPSIGPLTLDDEARIDLFGLNANDPTTLHAPFSGRARPGYKPLALLDGGRVRGRWTLTMLDGSETGTSTLASWRLRVAAGKPYQTKGTKGG
jgi:hypothetical protein